MALFPELSSCKDSVHCACASAEATLTLKEMSLFEVLYEAVEEDSNKDLASYGQQRYTPVIVAGLGITFPFVKVHNGGIFKFLSYDTFLPHGLEDVSQFLGEDRAQEDLCASAGIASMPRGSQVQNRQGQ